jgi:trimethylamine--corrinoid protein Co-methyltransferase
MAVRSRRNSSGRSRLKAGAAKPGPQAVISGQPQTYKPLSAQSVLDIHETAMRLLENVGMGFLDGMPDSTGQVLAAGAVLSETGRMLFPRALIEDTLIKVNRNWMLHGLDSRYDLEITPETILYGTAGAAVKMRDFRTQCYRPSTLLDLHNITRLSDTLPNIRWCHRPVVATDIEDAFDLDINTIYTVLSATGKPIGSSLYYSSHFEPVNHLLDTILGGEGEHKKRPVMHITQGLGVPPLRFANDRVKNAEAAIQFGIPMILGAAPQAGATGPAALAGTIAQCVAEVLAATVYVNLLAPGHPVLFGAWPFVSDLRTGSMSGGSAEQALLTAAVAQMARFYDIPSSIPAGMADSKVPDAQSGYEKGMSTVLAGLAGANMVHEAAGMQASLMGVSLEAFVIDNDMLGSVQRVLRGIEVNEETLSYDVVKDVIFGDGHYLGHAQTFSRMTSEYHYPPLSDRMPTDLWEEAGSLTIEERARGYVQETLSEHFPHFIPDALDKKIRSDFNIFLPREAMSAATSRWAGTIE